LRRKYERYLASHDAWPLSEYTIQLSL